MENKYFLQNSIEKIEKGSYSFFLDPKEKNFVEARLRKKKIPYQIYIPYRSAEKILLYSGTMPSLELLEIVSQRPLEHREILGTFFAHQILLHFYSDIMITHTHYVVVLPSIALYLKEQVHEIGGQIVSIEKRDYSVLENYQPNYCSLLFHVSSLRIDTIVAKITKSSRAKVRELFERKEVFLNYEVVEHLEYLLKEGDIFSIRGYGKYIFKHILYSNKKGNMNIEILKYI